MVRQIMVASPCDGSSTGQGRVEAVAGDKQEALGGSQPLLKNLAEIAESGPLVIAKNLREQVEDGAGRAVMEHGQKVPCFCFSHDHVLPSPPAPVRRPTCEPPPSPALRHARPRQGAVRRASV